MRKRENDLVCGTGANFQTPVSEQKLTSRNWVVEYSDPAWIEACGMSVKTAEWRVLLAFWAENENLLADCCNAARLWISKGPHCQRVEEASTLETSLENTVLRENPITITPPITVFLVIGILSGYREFKFLVREGAHSCFFFHCELFIFLNHYSYYHCKYFSFAKMPTMQNILCIIINFV